MNKQQLRSGRGHHPDNEHGTLRSYVIGFVLSLIFTFIPYYLVVNQTITGRALLLTILAFALVQVIIQVTFFLHLGRGPKPNWNLFFFVSTVGIIAIVVGGSVFITDNLYRNMAPSDQVKKLVNDEGISQIDGEKTGACQGQNSNYKITIKNNKATPSYIVASQCDTLTFINEDKTVREITFGTHPEHGVYAGEEELLVRRGRTKSLTLSETGTYQFHDHLDPGIAGQFSVNP